MRVEAVAPLLKRCRRGAIGAAAVAPLLTRLSRGDKVRFLHLALTSIFLCTAHLRRESRQREAPGWRVRARVRARNGQLARRAHRPRAARGGERQTQRGPQRRARKRG